MLGAKRLRNRSKGIGMGWKRVLWGWAGINMDCWNNWEGSKKKLRFFRVRYRIR